jgi:hypothetical protein
LFIHRARRIALAGAVVAFARKALVAPQFVMLVVPTATGPAAKSIDHTPMLLASKHSLAIERAGLVIVPASVALFGDRPIAADRAVVLASLRPAAALEHPVVVDAHGDLGAVAFALHRPIVVASPARHRATPGDQQRDGEVQAHRSLDTADAWLFPRTHCTPLRPAHERSPRRHRPNHTPTAPRNDDRG